MTKILVVSDLHVGSIYGLMPGSVEEESSAGGDENYTVHKPNRFQRSILKRWKDMVKKVGRVDVMVVNGDAVDGVNYRERGKSAWTTNLSTQVDAAADLVAMVDYKNLVVTQGSLYHVDSNISTDYALAKVLEGKFGDDYVVKTKEGPRFHFSHQIGVSSSSWQYRSTPIARELVAAVLHEDVFGKYHGVIRSHAHYFVMVNFGTSFGMITPGWQGRSPFVARKSLIYAPKLGWVMLEVDKDGTVHKDWTTWDVKNPVKELKL